MYVSLLRLYVAIADQSPLLYLGLVVLLMASWGLIITVVGELAVRLFDRPQR